MNTCNLSSYECDESEFEGPSGQLANYDGETVILLCVSVIIFLFVGKFYGVLRRKLSFARIRSTKDLAGAASPNNAAGHPPTPSLRARSCVHNHPPNAISPSPVPSSGDAVKHEQLFYPSPASLKSLRFSLSPGWKSAEEGQPSTLLKPRPSLLQHLSKLSQQLGLSGARSPFWDLLKGRDAKHIRTPGSGSPSFRSRRYGLGLGEVESADEDSDDDITSKQLRLLQQSSEFHQYLRDRGLTSSDVERTAAKMRVYRRLRQLDPSGFLLLCQAGSTRGFETQVPSRLLLALEYLLSLASTLAAAVATYQACTGSSTAAQVAWLGLAWWLTGAAWVQGRSSGGRVLGMWYEELRWGHSPPAWRVAAANLLEGVYVVGTGGIGAAVSLVLRCGRPRNTITAGGSGGGQRQSVGEMCGRVRQVREVGVALNLGACGAAAR